MTATCLDQIVPFHQRRFKCWPTWLIMPLWKRESTGSGANTHVETETVAKFELMDGAPVRGESIPIRLFLSPYEQAPISLGEVGLSPPTPIPPTPSSFRSIIPTPPSVGLSHFLSSSDPPPHPPPHACQSGFLSTVAASIHHQLPPLPSSTDQPSTDQLPISTDDHPSPSTSTVRPSPPPPAGFRLGSMELWWMENLDVSRSLSGSVSGAATTYAPRTRKQKAAAWLSGMDSGSGAPKTTSKRKARLTAGRLSKEQASANTANESVTRKVVDYVMLDEDLPDTRIVDLVLLEEESQNNDATIKNLKEAITATRLDVNSKLDEALQELRSLKTTVEEEELYKNREKDLEDKNAELRVALVDAESKLAMKESSQRNDQVPPCSVYLI
ncbi:hypothetical protein Vadar_001815 [Vaccinium darrowii]|uniref:Uncharacterized protein n=1 Tax=Vaccinium darrowii TaxID=229202 RepID=A0ACB7XER4_9ERIC|nr:hypothetical protein Vadar_001815 [Vaccinium darrowii]